jgi:interleukin-like EMT inducer protein
MKAREPLVLLGYAVSSIVLTFPVALHLTTHVPGHLTDSPALAWNLWWVKHALVDLSINPLFTNYVFYPIGIDLVPYTLTLFNGILAIPLLLAWGVVAANNILIWASLSLSAFGTYLLAKDVLRRAGMPVGAAIFAGALYGFGSYHMNYIALGQVNFVSNEWIPFCVLHLIRATQADQGRSRAGLMAGLFFVLTAWTELSLAAFLGMLVLVLLAFHWIRTRVFVRRELANIAALGLVSAIGIMPIVYDIFSETIRYGDYWSVGWARTQSLSADILSFILPSSLNPLLGQWTRDIPFQTMNFVFVGDIVLILAAWGAFRLRSQVSVQLWTVVALIFAVLMLGPSLQIAGFVTDIPLPFNLLHYVPILKANRYPIRLDVIFALAVALLASFALAEITRFVQTNARWKIVLAVVPTLALLEQLAVPLPLVDLQASPIFQTIAADQGDFTVLDLPLGWRDSVSIQGQIDYKAHFFQAIHEKRLIGGNTSRNPQWKFQYFLQAPIINSIVALETDRDLDDVRRAQDREIAREVLQFFDIRYIDVFRAKTDPNVLAYVLDVFSATEIYRDDERTVYRVAPTARGQGELDQLSESARLYFDSGWGRVQTSPEGFGYRWASTGQARMWLPLTKDDDELGLRLLAPAAMKITARLNGQLIQELNAGNSWNDYKIRIPANIAGDGLNELVFEAPPISLSASRLGDYHIGDSALVSPVDISATGAGFDAGRFGEIYVAGRNAIESQRGYHLVAVDPKTGAVDRYDHFDTFADPEESQRLAQFVADLPSGEIVAGVAVDEVSRQLQQVAVDALRTLGVDSDLRYQFREAHAFIGVKGAQPGQALESVDARFPANVAVGKNVSADHVTFALGPVTWEKAK